MSSSNQKSAMTTLGYFRAAREWVTPARTTSAFLEKGVLTPEEFVMAGDELVFRCPTWSWEVGDPNSRKPYLPDDKQYLVTRHVPCQARVSDMEELYKVQHDDDAGDEGDWLISSFVKKENVPLEDDFDILDEDGEVVSPPQPTVGNAEEQAEQAGDEDEYADMADFEDDNIIQDDDAVATTTDSASDNVLAVRTYDLSITYDKYYQTPRVWMVGNSAAGQPLTGPEMMQDVISDYANKTVTIEAHPHVAGPHASIHPCKHGRVMKTIVHNLIRATDEGEADTPSVEMYLFIFLKFVSSIIPTINYDFTMDVDVRGG